MARTEARLHETYAKTQAVLASVDERCEEVRNLVRLQGEHMLNIIGQRALAAAPSSERPALRAALDTLKEQIPESLELPPGGTRPQRGQRLREALEAWAEENGWRRVQDPYPEINSAIYRTGDGPHAPLCYVASYVGRMYSGAANSAVSRAMTLVDDWPGHPIVAAVLAEEPEWSHTDEQRLSFGADPDMRWWGVLLVTPSGLDELQKECDATGGRPGLHRPYLDAESRPDLPAKWD